MDGWPSSEGLDPPITQNPKKIFAERGGQLMSDFELLSIVLMVLAIIIPLLLEVIKTQKK